VRYRPLTAIAKNQRGATVTEFALILAPLCVMIMGTMEVGYQAYVRSVTLGAVETLTRAVTLQNADASVGETELRAQIRRVAPSATVDIVRGSVNRYNSFGTLERLTQDLNNNGILDGPVDTDGNGVKDKSDCWEDVDNNGVRNIVTTGANSIGGADDIVKYTVTVTYDRLLPINRFIGGSSRTGTQASTVVRRQPFEAQTAPTIRCKS
jgi:Flp pilus assembly protein TadG